MLAVGALNIRTPVFLAPMEDVTNAAFRRIAKRIAGPGLMFTEFVSAMAVHHGARKTLKKMRVFDEERPLGIQIFGSDIESMVETARLAEECGADLVDINMGCWVPKVCKTGAGAALIKDPELAEAIVRAVVRAVNVPVTVKVRAGWTYEMFAAPDLAKRFEAGGAQMLTLHARFAKQGFNGEADWILIERLRKAISIPLVGNGDVRKPDDALRMFTQTGCDAVMVGRAAVSNPWALRAIVEAVQGVQQSAGPTLRERIEVALEHLALMIRHETEAGCEPGRAETSAVRQLRGQIPLYIKGEAGAAELRDRLFRAETYTEVEQLLLGFEEQLLRRGSLAAAV